MSATKRRRLEGVHGKTLPPATDPADPDKHVVFPMSHTASELKQLLDEHKIIFVRSGVGNGKTTLAHFMTKDPEFHLVRVPREQDEAGRMHRIVSSIDEIAKNIFEHAPEATADLACVLQLLGDAGHVLVFDEAHLLFGIGKLCDVLFKDPVCHILLFSASSEGRQGPQDAISITPPTIAKFMWYPRAPSEKEVKEMVADLTKIGVGIDEPTFGVLYMLSGGNRDIFMHALRWLAKKHTRSDVALATVRLGLAQPWGTSTGFLDALQRSRAVQANGGYEDVRNVPELFVRILAGGPQVIVDPALRRPLTIGGLIVPYVSSADSLTDEFVEYNWNKPQQKYTTSSALRAAFYGSSLKLPPFSMTYECSPATEATTCAALIVRAFPLMDFIEVVQRPVVDDGSTLSLASAIRGCGLAPEDDYNGAFQRALGAQGFATRDFKSSADGGKIDHLVWVDSSDAKPTFGLEFEHFGDKPKRKDHAFRFTKEGMDTYRLAKHNALVVLCTTQHQVETVMKEAMEDATFRPPGVDVITLLVSTSHESYTMTVLMDMEASPWPPLVLNCDHVAKKIVEHVDGWRTLESAQRLGHIAGMKYQEEESGAMEMAGPAAVSDTVVISVQLGADGAPVKVKFSRSAVSADIKEAIRDRLRLRLGTRFELVDADGVGVTIDGNLEPSNYIVEVIE